MDSAEPTKPRTITDTIKQLFRSAAKAITGDDEDEPQPERRRKKEGESESGFMQLARSSSLLFTTKPRMHTMQDVRGGFREGRAAITRRDTIPDDLFGATGGDWSDTLAMLNQWNDEELAAGFDDCSAVDHNYGSLSL
jgi:hypothetical protein